MNQDDLFDSLDQLSIDDLLSDLDALDAVDVSTDGLFDDIDALHADDMSFDALEDILRQFHSSERTEPKAEPEPPARRSAPAPRGNLSQPDGVLDDLPDAEPAGAYRPYAPVQTARAYTPAVSSLDPEDWYGQEEPELIEDGEPPEDEYEFELEAAPRRRRRHPVLSGVGHGLLVFATVMAACYLIVVYTNIGFIKNLRTTYIQTAMSTLNHKWLATALIPSDTIREVMRVKYESEDAMIGVNTEWGNNIEVQELPRFDTEEPIPDESSVEVGLPQEETVEGEEPLLSAEAQTFFEVFWELDQDSVVAYMREHPEALANGWAGVDVNESGLDDDGTSMVTIYGDQVLAVNAVDGVTLIRLYLSSNRSRGVMAICKDTSRLSLCPATTLGVVGQTAGKICRDNDGILAMTGSAFVDPEGVGNGGELSGLAVCHGQVMGERLGSGAKRLELREDNRMYIVDSTASVSSDTRDACEFQPALIVDGTVYHDGFWTELNPRVALGQTNRLESMLVVVEGRYADSLGCSTTVVADKMAEYGCVQALNLDGGTSAMMYYKGEYVNRCSNDKLPEGRTLPTAWVYKPYY